MAIKTLIYSALSLGIASGATVGGYFIFKPDTTKQESTSSQTSSAGSVTPERVTNDNPEANRAGGSQSPSQGTDPVQNQVTERRDSASPGTAITPNSSGGDRGPSGP